MQARGQEQGFQQVMPIPPPPSVVPKWQVSTPATLICCPLVRRIPLDPIMKRREQGQGQKQ